MIKPGFVSAILPDLTFEEVISFAAEVGYSCVEIMCWPPGKAERRYAGVTHIDVTDLSESRVDSIHKTLEENGVAISGLGYYPNPLEADEASSKYYIEHIKKVIDAAKLLGLGNVNTFVGRDHTSSVEDNFARFKELWPPIVKHAEEQGVKIDLGAMPLEGVARCRAAWARLTGRQTCVVHGDPNNLGNVRMTADRVALVDWDESHVDVPDLDLVLPNNAAGLDDGAHDIAAQASAAWEAAVCWDDEYAVKRLAEVRAV